MRQVRLILKWGLSLCVCAWALGAAIFIMILPSEIPDTAQVTDSIVVLTGGAGRVPMGFKLLAEGKAKALFISGVGEHVRLQDLAPDLPMALQQYVTMGGAASDTVGNAAETAEWVKKNGYHSIRLVTSYYHMPRSLIEFRHYLPDLQIIPHPVFPDDITDQVLTGGQKFWLLIREYNKYLVASLRYVWA